MGIIVAFGMFLSLKETFPNISDEGVTLLE
jgi:hypothetical protein